MRNFIDKLFSKNKDVKLQSSNNKIRYMAFNWHSTHNEILFKITIKVHNFYQLNDIFHKNYRVYDVT